MDKFEEALDPKLELFIRPYLFCPSNLSKAVVFNLSSAVEWHLAAMAPLLNVSLCMTFVLSSAKLLPWPVGTGESDLTVISTSLYPKYQN